MTLLINLKKAEHPKMYIAAREQKQPFGTCLFVAPDRTASKKTSKWGCFCTVFDGMSLNMTKRIL